MGWWASGESEEERGGMLGVCVREERGGGGKGGAGWIGDERTLGWRNAGDLHPLTLALQCVGVHANAAFE